MAWDGLDFQNNSALTDDDKDRIQNRLSAEMSIVIKLLPRLIQHTKGYYLLLSHYLNLMTSIKRIGKYCS